MAGVVVLSAANSVLTKSMRAANDFGRNFRIALRRCMSMIRKT